MQEHQAPNKVPGGPAAFSLPPSALGLLTIYLAPSPTRRAANLQNRTAGIIRRVGGCLGPADFLLFPTSLLPSLSFHWLYAYPSKFHFIAQTLCKAPRAPETLPCSGPCRGASGGRKE